MSTPVALLLGAVSVPAGETSPAPAGAEGDLFAGALAAALGASDTQKAPEVTLPDSVPADALSELLHGSVTPDSAGVADAVVEGDTAKDEPDTAQAAMAASLAMAPALPLTQAVDPAVTEASGEVAVAGHEARQVQPAATAPEPPSAQPELASGNAIFQVVQGTAQEAAPPAAQPAAGNAPSSPGAQAEPEAPSVAEPHNARTPTQRARTDSGLVDEAPAAPPPASAPAIPESQPAHDPGPAVIRAEDSGLRVAVQTPASPEPDVADARVRRGPAYQTAAPPSAAMLRDIETAAPLPATAAEVRQVEEPGVQRAEATADDGTAASKTEVSEQDAQPYTDGLQPKGKSSETSAREASHSSQHPLPERGEQEEAPKLPAPDALTSEASAQYTHAAAPAAPQTATARPELGQGVTFAVVPQTSPAPSAGAAAPADASHLSESRSAALEQVVSTAKLAVSKRATDLTVQLDPPGLGRLNVKVSISGGELTAHLTADNPATYNLIAAHQADIRQSLGQAGLRLDQLTVMDFGASAQGFGRHPNNPGNSYQQPLPGAYWRQLLAEDPVNIEQSSITGRINYLV